MAAGYTGSLLAGNVPVTNRMAENLLARNKMAGNSPRSQMAGSPSTSRTAAYSTSLNQMAGNFPRSQMASNTPAANQMAGNPPRSQLAGYQEAATQLAGNFPAINPPMENQSLRIPPTGNAVTNQPARNFSAGNSSLFRMNSTKLASKFLTNTEQNDASVSPTSSNDGPLSHEDRSGLYTNFYRQPPSYDKKNTIYYQTSWRPNYYGNVNTYGNILPPPSDVRRSGVISPGQYTGSYPNYLQQTGHSTTNYQQYNSYPSYQQQQWRGGYPASPGYQVNYPGMSQQGSSGYPGTKEANDSVSEQLDKKWTVPRKSEDTKNNKSNEHDDSTLQKLSTIQRKLPEKPVRKSTSPSTQSVPEDNASSSGISSGSGSGFDEADDIEMEDTADIQESRERSGSGSDDDDEDLNGDTSNVAFMLAGTNSNRNKPPLFPFPGLPMNLTRKQAIDIYKSALYFAGLLREGE